MGVHDCWCGRQSSKLVWVANTALVGSIPTHSRQAPLVSAPGHILRRLDDSLVHIGVKCEESISGRHAARINQGLLVANPFLFYLQRWGDFQAI